MPAFLEAELKKKYGGDSAIPYKIMNKLRVMKGSKETAKGRAWDTKHASDVKKGKA